MDGTDRADLRNERRFSASGRHRYNGRVRRPLSATGLLVGAAIAVGVSACGGSEQASTTTEASTTGSSTSAASTAPDRGARPRPEPDGAGHNEPTRERSGNHPVRAAVSETKPARLDAAQRRAAAVVRDYVTALNSRNGGRVCALFAPGALNEVGLPRDRGDCATSLGSSIGYRDPRGFPVYRGSHVARIASVEIDGADARVVATVVTDFAGNREPSIEDDVVYLHQQGGSWLIAKPSAALYRAIGVGDIPPTVLAPPK